jgi:hypothetical protein
MPRVPVEPMVGEGMVVFRVRVRSPDVVFFKGVLDAHDGLCQVFAESGGDLTIAGPQERAQEIDAVLADLCAETGAVRTGEP